MDDTDGREMSEFEVREVPPARDTLLPINFKRLTKTYVFRIAEKVELPSTASAEETRQLIEGKLLEMGKELLNVQVELEQREQGEFILLRDVDGVFLEVEPHVEEPRRSRSSSAPSEELETGEDSAVGVESLCTALYAAQSQNEALVNEMRSLKEELK